ncbi:MAG: flagellar basal body rod modification protein [Rhizobiales bacterium]|nr:flagellar basal body rod modification protein [Hoeflea sp.]MBG19517.1 flagellar basal body rod modification protein [Hyphomicrobiales bacterium]|tara:strand:- start:538 stop:930 length:393 start_codon:yes stop_codon:yes gene_type:complete
MDVSAVSSATASASSKASAKATMDYDTFLKLLVAQMQNQDPTEPMDSTEQIAQLATFSQVEQTIKTNENLEMLLLSSTLNQAGSIIGRTLESADGTVSGVVTSVQVYSDGLVATLEDGTKAVVGAGMTIR